MRVLVAGATSVPGIVLLRELNARGHDVVGLTSQPARTSEIEQQGAKPVVANVFDAAQIKTVVGDIEPEVVVSLLTTLPKWGPKRAKDFEPAKKLWSQGRRESGGRGATGRRAPGGGGVGRLRIRLPDGPGRRCSTKAIPIQARRSPAVRRCLAALRGMEQNVLTSGEHSDTEGIVLRYGIFYGPHVPHTELFTRLAQVVGVPSDDRQRNGVLGAHRRRREGDGRRSHQRAWR